MGSRQRKQVNCVTLISITLHASRLTLHVSRFTFHAMICVPQTTCGIIGAHGKTTGPISAPAATLPHLWHARRRTRHEVHRLRRRFDNAHTGGQAPTVAPVALAPTPRLMISSGARISCRRLFAVFVLQDVIWIKVESPKRLSPQPPCKFRVFVSKGVSDGMHGDQAC